jgi:hypothetical protein
VTFGFLLAGFLGATNAGRVALALTARRGTSQHRDLAVALAAGAALIVAAVFAADPLLDALDISPESWRIAAAVVLAATAIRTIIWPTWNGPFAAVLVTPELAALSISFGADESAGKVLAAAAVALIPALLAAHARRRETSALAAQFLAALQIVVAVALAVSGIRDV